MNKQRGFSLLQMMITMAVLGVLLVVFDKVFVAGLQAWAHSQKGFEVHQACRSAKDLILQNLRQARMNTVVISRYENSVATAVPYAPIDHAEPMLSKVWFVDAQGDTRSYYQQGTNLMETREFRANATDVPKTITNTAIRSILQRFNVYYPDVKDYSRIAFSFAVKTKAWANDPKDMELLNTGNVELKTP